MNVPDLFSAQGWTGLRYLSPLVFLWLAFIFGRTLRSGATPLIERIARRGSTVLSAPLVRYVRWLSAIWCGYFVGAAAFSAYVAASGGASPIYMGFAVLAGSMALFVGEHWLRAKIFPHEAFPGLRQQLSDTLITWRTPDQAATRARR